MVQWLDYQRLPSWLRLLLPQAIVLALCLVLGAIWIGQWTDAGPTYFPGQVMNPQETRQLPGILHPVAEDRTWWLFLHFPADPQDYGALLMPVGMVGVLCWILRDLPCNNSSRLVIKLILLYLGGRYFYWRTVATLNHAHWLSTLFSYGVWLVESIAFASFTLYTFHTIATTTERRDDQAKNYWDPNHPPTVDIFIPTHNESEDIVRRTVIGCQVIADDYRAKDRSHDRDPEKVKIYVLDDNPKSRKAIWKMAQPSRKATWKIARPSRKIRPGREDMEKTVRLGHKDGLSRKDRLGRKDIRKMAKELGCRYIAHPCNRAKKAGNLNHALKSTHGELIAVFDADFVPYMNFLTQTIGFFQQDPKVDMVQTPQDFYNPDYHARNLGLDNFLPNDMEHFYGLLQPNRDRWNSVICCGSSYVVRRKSLEEVGGYYTKCCVEDFQTSLKFLTNGKTIVYLNQILSQGDSPRSFDVFMKQRLRWLQGNVQVYFREDLPIWSKLNWVQKTFMVSLALYCLHPLIRVVFLLTPLISIYSGIAPVLAPFREMCYYFLPFWLLLITVYGWASDYRINYFWNECYETVFCFPALARLWRMAWEGTFAEVGTAVTAKGNNPSDRAKADNGDAYLHPLKLILVATAVILLLRLFGLYQGWWPRLNDHTVPLLFWLGHNTLIVWVSVLGARDKRDDRNCDRFPLEKPCTLMVNSDLPLDGSPPPHGGYTCNISESGALLDLQLDSALPLGTEVTLRLHKLDKKVEFETKAKVSRCEHLRHQTKVAVQFVDLTVAPQRQLVKLLYSTDYWWKRRKQPRFIDSVLAIFAALLEVPMPPIYASAKDNPLEEESS
jgi:cellulose synthase/poly-beta-1,6-N-acetylglucosamine synthase-like glycosyltransferase